MVPASSSSSSSLALPRQTLPATVAGLVHEIPFAASSLTQSHFDQRQKKKEKEKSTTRRSFLYVYNIFVVIIIFIHASNMTQGCIISISKQTYGINKRILSKFGYEDWQTVYAPHGITDKRMFKINKNDSAFKQFEQKYGFDKYKPSFH